jgi:hypothetical protein
MDSKKKILKIKKNLEEKNSILIYAVSLAFGLNDD